MRKIIIADKVISETKAFLQKQGRAGFEGRVYWIGIKSNSTEYVKKIVIPEQIPRRTAYGVSITVSQKANIDVARNLNNGEYIIAKVHSHPGEAYNSEVDKRNPFLRHEGAISIIVPNFGNAEISQLNNCVVCNFTNGYWRELNTSEINRLFTFSR